MPSVATCPRCKSELALPADFDGGAQAECPICQVEFSLTAIVPRQLPEVRVVSRAAASQAPIAAEVPGDADAINDATSPAPEHFEAQPVEDNLSRLLRATSAWGETSASSDEHQSVDVSASPAPLSNDINEPDSTESQSATDALKLGSSRLDQLLSDLMTSSPALRSNANADSIPLHAEIGATSTDIAESPAAREPLITGFDSELPELDDSDNHDDVSWTPSDQPGVPDIPPQALRTTPRRRRGPKVVRTLVGVVGGGVFGLFLGAYGLLWLRGTAGDVAGLSRWLPPALLPPSMRQVADSDDVSDANASVAHDNAVDAARSAAPDQTPSATKFDPAVTAASSAEPIPSSPKEATPSVTPDQQQVREVDAPAATIWPTTPLVRDLRGTPLYSLAQFREALPAAKAALPIFLAGNLARQESWPKMGPAYMSLCALAERFTLTDPAAYGTDLIAAQAEAKTLFNAALADEARRADLALIAARWLEHDRRQNEGVILAGRVAQARRDGAWTKYTIEVAAGTTDNSAVVLADQADFAAGDEIAIVGAIIPQPRDRITGFERDDRQVILAGYMAPLGPKSPAGAASASPQ